MNAQINLIDYCYNYIDNTDENNLNEQIYDLSCDYIRGVATETDEKILIEFFN